MGATQSAVPAVEAVDLTKQYSVGKGKEPVHAVRGLTFTAAQGRVFGLLGPNGAGKSTTVKILSTLSVADSGTARVAGIDVREHPDQVRRAIGYVSQKSGTDPSATATENLVLAGRLQGMSRTDAVQRANELINRFGLTKAADRLVRTYSGGMARKLDIALGLMHRPRVLFLDEPTTGLDPQARSEMWTEIARLAQDEGMAVLLTTHYLEEVDQLARRLAIVDHGTVIAEGTPDELKSQLHGDAVQIELAQIDDRALTALGQVRQLHEITVSGKTIRARTTDGAQALPPALAVLEKAGIPVRSATLARPSLDDVYLGHTGHILAEDSSANQAEVAK